MASRTARLTGRDQSKRETREALVDAALELIPARGLDVSLDDICDRAGFTRGAFYVHFADRDALLAAVMERVGGRVLDVLIGAAAGGDDLGTLVGRFEGALASGVYPLTRAGGVRPYQLLDACARSPAVRKQYVALVCDGVARLSARLASEQRGGKIRKDVRAGDQALLLMAIAIGVHTLVDLDAPLDLQRAGSSLLELLRPIRSSRGRSPRARRTPRT